MGGGTDDGEAEDIAILAAPERGSLDAVRHGVLRALQFDPSKVGSGGCLLWTRCDDAKTPARPRQLSEREVKHLQPGDAEPFAPAVGTPLGQLGDILEPLMMVTAASKSDTRYRVLVIGTLPSG